MRRHILSCNEYHQHEAPKCCDFKCWCRQPFTASEAAANLDDWKKRVNEEVAKIGLEFQMNLVRQVLDEPPGEFTQLEAFKNVIRERIMGQRRALETISNLCHRHDNLGSDSGLTLSEIRDIADKALS